MAKKSDTPGAGPQAEMMVSVDQFVKTRDSVIVSLSNLQEGLAHVQSGLNELLRAYMHHTSSILEGGQGTLDNVQLPPNIAATAHAALEAATNATQTVSQAVTVSAPAATPAPSATAAAAAATAAGAGAPPEKKKRKRNDKKKERDPNAPKRPLTAAFLYAQQARPYIKHDLEAQLGPDDKLEPNAVNLEVNKRWNEMAEEGKEKWRVSYRESMEKFKVEWAAYQQTLGVTGAEVAVTHDDEEGSDEAEAGALDSDAESDDDEEVPAPTPVAKTPAPPAANTKTPRANKRQKMTETPAMNGSHPPVLIAPASFAQTTVPIPLPASRQATQAPAPNSNVEVATPATTKKDRKKKLAANAQPVPIAPASAKEPTPDDTKKKTKSGRTTRNTEAEEEAPVAEKPAAKKRDRSKRKTDSTAP
ncbi:hypothetical protein BDV95DRAFT_578990 [Massariosphaeria phaeospora]|uniref:HMG box domain-containing protein n=1 Tax=Massariosphaeria phaeospora TaxID=100035 RepID=A0A7C8I5I1_9PLEO|nr:hypothetical protein BDV95DRAFT_578990 [Massariosphaeria phaeospora]